MLGAQEKEPLGVPRLGKEGFPEWVVFELGCEDELCRQGKLPAHSRQREARKLKRCQGELKLYITQECQNRRCLVMKTR